MIGKAPDCLKCKHFEQLKYGLKCKAFPNGIPDDILMGTPHTKPTKNQKNKIVFEEIE